MKKLVKFNFLPPYQILQRSSVCFLNLKVTDVASQVLFMEPCFMSTTLQYHMHGKNLFMWTFPDVAYH
jgi:hypothetical protein